MKNLTLGYTLPQAWLTKAGIANAKVFLTGENLFTFTGLDGGIDPEESNERGWSYSNVKKLSVGIKILENQENFVDEKENNFDISNKTV